MQSDLFRSQNETLINNSDSKDDLKMVYNILSNFSS